MGIQAAEHAEYNPNASTLLIVPAACPVSNRPAGAPRLSSKLKVKLRLNSSAFQIYRQQEIEEEFNCNYELNPAFQSAIEAKGLQMVGLGERGEARIVELDNHRFFVATLFLPQLTSTEDRPHPLIVAYLKAVLSSREESLL